jgi:glucose-1-phosphate thymidylyltransferase
VKGLLLAGGKSGRLFPITRALSKQLVPVYDKPLVYYPLSVLMLAGIREVLVITRGQDVGALRQLLGSGDQWGMRFEYAEQPRPDGIAQSLLIGRDFLDGQPCALILGDNIFYGQGLRARVREAASRAVEASGATIFAYRMNDPSAYGVVEFARDGRVRGLEEKPARPKSKYAVTGLYFYDPRACELAASLRPSARGELEITELNRLYLERGALHAEVLGRGLAWLDTGTPEALLQASSFIQTVQARQGMQVACPEEIAYSNGWLGATELAVLARSLRNTAYGEYLDNLLRNEP